LSRINNNQVLNNDGAAVCMLFYVLSAVDQVTTSHTSKVPSNRMLHLA